MTTHKVAISHFKDGWHITAPDKTQANQWMAVCECRWTSPLCGTRKEVNRAAHDHDPFLGLV